MAIVRARVHQVPHHLLVCAPDWVGRLDPAFLRPGRFDFILLVGPPDAAARRSIWQRYVSENSGEDGDLDALVEATDLFTAADIEFAAAKPRSVNSNVSISTGSPAATARPIS